MTNQERIHQQTEATRRLYVQGIVYLMQNTSKNLEGFLIGWNASMQEAFRTIKKTNGADNHG